MAFVLTRLPIFLVSRREQQHKERNYEVRFAKSPNRETQDATRSVRVTVIGGGAAGHLAAISLHHHLNQHGVDRAVHTCILEGNKEVLTKVRRSGGGRCNVTNVDGHEDIRGFSTNYARGERIMPSVLHRYGPVNIMQLFESNGVELKIENDGKIFPVSDTSLSITQCLQRLLKQQRQITVKTNQRVEQVHYEPSLAEYLIQTNSIVKQRRHKQNFKSDYVIVATGSDRITWKWIDRLGHTIVPPVASLFSFGIRDEGHLLHGLSGLSVQDVVVKLGRLTQRGSILVTHWGLSGPVVLSLSSYGARLLHEAQYQAEIEINWLPHFSYDEVARELKRHRLRHPKKQVSSHYPSSLHQIPRRLWERITRTLTMPNSNTNINLSTWGQASDKHVAALVSKLIKCPLCVSSKGPFKDEFVTAGGVHLKQVDTKTFQSKLLPRLYFAGETLDVDAKTGGYNLQFAWSSGWIVGNAVAVDIFMSTGNDASSDKSL